MNEMLSYMIIQCNDTFPSTIYGYLFYLVDIMYEMYEFVVLYCNCETPRIRYFTIPNLGYGLLSMQ